LFPKFFPIVLEALGSSLVYPSQSDSRIQDQIFLGLHLFPDLTHKLSPVFPIAFYKASAGKFGRRSEQDKNLVNDFGVF
jgi:hypothetical protein